jgi:hypothetical protein
MWLGAALKNRFFRQGRPKEDKGHLNPVLWDAVRVRYYPGFFTIWVDLSIRYLQVGRRLD